MDPETKDRQPFTVVFRPEVARALASNVPDPVYFAPLETIRQIGNDFVDQPGGVYDVFTADGRPRILALRFADVLRID